MNNTNNKNKAQTKHVINHTIRFFILATILIAFHLVVGMLGYRYICGFDWVDAFLNSSMIMGGMGEINALTDNSSKIFAGVYALFSGLIFIVIISILIYPVLKASMIRLHLDNYRD
ncbi:MAG TPA: hypothetical protein VHP32_03865 [Ignavibacteria bacterium]|nr:hypothetical protein [Ignavibacteria bacterium]